MASRAKACGPTMPSTTTTLIPIGTLSDIDTDESDFDNENPSAAYGTYSSAVMRDITVTQTDVNGDAQLQNDDSGQAADSFTYDLGGGPITSALDNEGRYSATYVDEFGATQATTISVYQLQNGDAFVRLPDGIKLQSLTITGIVADGFSSITYGTSSTAMVVCFAEGTLLQTTTGPRLVEQIGTGDRLHTLDNGAVPVRWVGDWRVAATQDNAPVLFAPGALGPGMPEIPLRLSPQHRVLVRSRVAARLGCAEGALVAAIRLVGLPGITRCDARRALRYRHLMCARHELVLADGAWCETLLPAAQALAALPRLDRVGLMLRRCASLTPVRPILSGPRLDRLLHQGRRQTAALVEAGNRPVVPCQGPVRINQ